MDVKLSVSGTQTVAISIEKQTMCCISYELYLKVAFYNHLSLS